MESYNRNNNNNSKNFNNSYNSYNGNRNFNNNNKFNNNGGNPNGNKFNNNGGNGNYANKANNNYNNSNSNLPTDLTIATNYFRFKHLDTSKNCYYKYSIDFLPDLPGDSKALRRHLFMRGREKLNEKFGKTIFNNTTFYSKENISSEVKFDVTAKSGESYSIRINWACKVENESFESLSLYTRFFNNLIKHLNFIDMKRSYFNPNNAMIMNDYQLEIWSGFAPTVSLLKSGILLNLNVTHKVIRTETVYNFISQLRESLKQNSDPDNISREIRERLERCSVITRYNGGKNYIIDSVCFEKTPEDFFENKKGEKIKFKDYYAQKYKKNVNGHQPLLKVIDSRTKQEIFLIPELCYFTGLTDQLRSNFNFMKDMAIKTKGNPTDKLRETKNIISSILNNENCKKEIENWGITMDENVIKLNAKRLNTGNILMATQQGGNRLKLDIDTTPDLDRKIQNEMYSQPKLNNWIFIYQGREKQAADNFLNTFKEVIKTFNYMAEPPMQIEVQGSRFEDWKKLLLNNVSLNTQLVVCLISGNRGNGGLYKPLKNFLLTERPIPSQIMLSGTINKPKGLRSVVNKILIQVCAKLGGEPWAMEDLPFTKEPTMVCAIESYDKKTLRSPIMSLCATYNNIFTKYVSLVREAKQKENGESDIDGLLSSCLNEALVVFRDQNKVLPKHIIIFRDGVPQSRFNELIKSDVDQMKKTISSIDPEAKIDITYLTSNKKTNVKLFFEDNHELNNCPPGTVIEKEITTENFKDFYLISQKTTQGVSQPTHYYIAYQDKPVNEKDVYMLVYKLCYLYYNWTGAVRIPAPVQNVKKLIRLVTEKLSDRNNTTIPNDRFHKVWKSLYFL